MAGLATTAGNILAPPLLTRLKLKPPSTPLLSLSSFQSNLFGLRLCISTFHFQSFPLSLSSSHQVSVSARYSGKNNDDDQALDISTVRSDKVRLIDEQQNMVVLSPDADPPVVRIMNYDKYRYEQQKKKREQQKKSAASRMDLKELKMGYNIDVHDYSVRLRAAQKFLKDGDKVKVMVTMKGREKAFIDKAIQLIRKFQSDLGELATEEHNNFARRKKEDFTERFIFLILVPNKNVVQKAPEGPKKKRDSAPNEVSAAPNEVSAAPNEVSVASNEVSAGV
ncbi:translation initiation factor IF3-4, chloroplastic-like isoform X2 [Chenopodium quinoa]|uniref:translation initiation factor IF3-4, chloroplastic-like isoform X2 n=1 Tax=Chenopodium quinoa TaxID=63459 RepID=UPI000B77C9BF|nr:translation initiation factor IF3-4, chloroplastic-like isoform X2 [Chenopodium quinoa]